MKRPLESDPPVNPALSDLLTSMIAPSWQERARLKFYMAARRAFNLPLSITHYHATNSCMTFDNLTEIMDRLDLAKITPHLQADRVLRYPPEAPAIDQSRHFAQWALVWEPIDRSGPMPAKAHRTLRIEIGAGMHMLSLTFTPLRQDSFSDKMQLDDLTVYHGHDVYDLPLDITESLEETRTNVGRVARLFGTARATIEMMHDDYPLAETALADGCRPVLDDLREEALACQRREEAEERAAANPQIPQNGGNPGLYKPQEP